MLAEMAEFFQAWRKRQAEKQAAEWIEEQEEARRAVQELPDVLQDQVRRAVEMLIDIVNRGLQLLPENLTFFRRGRRLAASRLRSTHRNEQGKADQISHAHDLLEARNRSQYSPIDLRLSQVLDRRFGADGRIVHLFERIRPSLGAEHWQDFDVPVVIVVDGLPIPQGFRRVLAVGRGVQHKVKLFGEGAHTLQGAAQKGGEIYPQSRLC